MSRCYGQQFRTDKRFCSVVRKKIYAYAYTILKSFFVNFRWISFAKLTTPSPLLFFIIYIAYFSKFLLLKQGHSPPLLPHFPFYSLRCKLHFPSLRSRPFNPARISWGNVASSFSGDGSGALGRKRIFPFKTHLVAANLLICYALQIT